MNEVTKQPTRRPPTLKQMRTSLSTMPALYIEHRVTADMADGQPLPPLIENGVVGIWRIVPTAARHGSEFLSPTLRARRSRGVR